MKNNVIFKIISWIMFIVGSAGLLYSGFDVSKLIDIVKLLATIVGSIGALLVPILSLFRKKKDE